jgi:hypothetical protein
MTTIESWFVPFNILMVVCTTSVVILGILFLSIIVLDKTCHTVPMMLIANSCVTASLLGSSLLSTCIFTLENDLKQIQFQDSLCILRAYFIYVSTALFDYSILLQAIYRYVCVVYPNRLFWQSARFQFLSICLTWIFSFVYPTAFVFTDEIVYNIDNQICQLPFRLSFCIIYTAFCIYLIPMPMIVFIYFKLVRYVREMGKRVTPANTLLRAQRELKMVQRTVILISILVILGFPYALFLLMSFFTASPKYNFRIAYIFIDVSSALVMITLFQFTDPLKASVMKKLKHRSNRVVAMIA